MATNQEDKRPDDSVGANQLSELELKYRAGELTKGQYQYRRRKLLAATG